MNRLLAAVTLLLLPRASSARHSFAAAVIATSLCSGIVGNPDNSVQGPGACSLPRQK